MNLLPRPRRIVRLDGRAEPHAEPVEHRDPSLPAQGYRLRVDADGVEIVAADEPGAAYARATLAQLRRLEDVGAVSIEDHPDRPIRGVMLDVSRDKVPTLETLCALVDRMAGWKLNHLQLYTEHTFAHAGHEMVWEAASPYTAEDVRRLDDHCRSRHVELAANRNCLGHMERWLRFERYRPLGLPVSFTDPFGRTHPPMTLDPANPATLPFVADLLDEMVPCFTSGRVHVGLDEPYGIGEEGLRSYLSHLHGLRGLGVLDGKEMLVWGEVLYGAGGRSLGDVPDGVVCCVWGYEAGYPFEKIAGRLRDAGCPFWVCPGTSTWLGPTGRLPNAVRNVAAAAAVEDAAGMMVCDWGDYGHLQHLPVSEAAIAYAAATSWCRASNEHIDLAPTLDAHVYLDGARQLGRAMTTLGSAYELAGAYTPNMAVFTLPLYYPDIALGVGYGRYFSSEGVTPSGLDDVVGAVQDAKRAAARSSSARADAALIADEIALTADLVEVVCTDGRERLRGDGTLASLGRPVRARLASALRPLVDRHRELWLARNRPGGLDDSAWRIENLVATYETGTPLGDFPPGLMPA